MTISVPETASLDVRIERPVVGGRMLGRHEGRVVLVSGAIPGEHVVARIERTTKQVIFASTHTILEGSPFRRTPTCDLRCGGLAYAHIDVAHQRDLKAAIVVDAFRRLGGITVEPPFVEASPEAGYRLRARLHVRDGRAGFFLEGTHALCDASATWQLRPEALAVVEAVLCQLGDAASRCEAVSVAENIAATERVLHLEPREGDRLSLREGVLTLRDGFTGVTTQVGTHLLTLVGEGLVTDLATDLFGPRPPVPSDVRWSRSGASFFQGNRYLVGSLVRHVLAAVEGPRVVDLYAGVGLFSVALASIGLSVSAVEGDPISAGDLERNAAAWAARLRVRQASVEYAAARMTPGEADTVVLDPPRTGLSPDALAAVIRLAAPRLVYVSCDPATLARDTRALLAAGWALQSVRSFDLFPNTPHIETVAVFGRDQ